MNKRETVTFAVRWAIECAMHERERFPSMVDKPNPAGIANDCLAVLRLAGQHRRACEAECSIPPDPNDPRQWVRMIECAESSILARLEPYGIGAKFSSDPRGATVRLLLPSGYSDHPEGGYCVPADGWSVAQLRRMSR